MRHDHDTEEDVAARDQLQQAIMIAFCNVMHATRLPPMTVLRFAAMALGAVYRDAADVHRGHNSCSCGWKPSDGADIEALQKALAAMARSHPVVDLLAVEVVGRA